MYNVDKGLKKTIIQLNRILSTKYGDVLSLDKKTFRDFIHENVGTITKIQRLNRENISLCAQKGGILGVDGSNNRMGGAYPHFVEIYQGLALSSIEGNRPIFKTDFYTPLYPEEGDNPLEDLSEGEESIRKRKLSTIEVEAALEGIKQFNPYAVFMDGSLIRYNIECSDIWMELREECEKRNIVIIGIIEDIKTSIIGKLLSEHGLLEREGHFYDRELLYGLLEYGEMILIDEGVTKKSDEGFSTLFMRSSQSPAVIGIDILDSQREYLEYMARLILSLTPEDGRGIPLWLDIVDREVRIPNQMIKGLLESYLDREILELFFVPERDKRTL
ncbi:MAG TPA: DNA double-strand break repair nuclease NurA [Tepidimicrobium sp.]|nr:DNA double-strand break repair nuclease NurA [Tepidimicrobium sp.]